MRQELENNLTKKFPNLYRHINTPITQSCMGWGFECGDGWYDLIYELSEQLENLILQTPEAERHIYAADQVKEKYGELCFYMVFSTDEMDNLIEKATKKSIEICETCGNPGKTRCKNGWFFTACEEHSMGVE